MDWDTFEKEVKKRSYELEPFLRAFAEESDRGLAIVAECLLDNLLGRIITAAYIRNPKVKSIFKKSNVLQSFYTKIHIAYFSGLIPKFAYDDLLAICTVRNKFAHKVMADLKFSDVEIARLVDELITGCPKISESASRIRFTVAISQYVAILLTIEHFLYKERPPHLVELLKLDR